MGDERNPGVITTADWADLAQRCGLRPRFLQERVRTLATALLQQLQPVKEQFEALYGAYPALQRVEQVVTKQCRRALAF